MVETKLPSSVERGRRLVEPGHGTVSMVDQCRLLGLAQSSPSRAFTLSKKGFPRLRSLDRKILKRNDRFINPSETANASLPERGRLARKRTAIRQPPCQQPLPCDRDGRAPAIWLTRTHGGHLPITMGETRPSR